MSCSGRSRRATGPTTTIVDLSDLVTMFVPAGRQSGPLRWRKSDSLEENAGGRGTIVRLHAKSSEYAKSVRCKIEGSTDRCGPVAVFENCHIGDLGALENSKGCEGTGDPIAEDEHRLNPSVCHDPGCVLERLVRLQVGG